jgi:ABC-type transport system substrate-binding protein
VILREAFDYPFSQLDFRAWLRAGSQEELGAAAAAVQKVFAEELPFIPLATPNDVWAHSPRVHNWRPYAANLYPYYQDVHLEPVA